jgi:hydroxymethylglutaryl-CoA lyase
LNERIRITEVGPRDGLQNETTPISTQAKIDLVESLVEAGVTQIEVTSFVHPIRVPAMSDAESVFTGVRRREGVRYMTLTPNERGYDRARAVGCDAVAVFTAASEAFAQANIQSSIADSLERFRVVAGRSNSDQVYLRGYVSTVFDCPYAGPVEPESVLEVVESLLEMGCDEIALGDTTGSGTPSRVAHLLDVLLPVLPVEQLTLHFHDTWGLGCANAAAGIAHGVRSFDASVGGLGGCPYAPGASGNVATEDLVHLVHSLGFETGIDLEGVVAAGAQLSQHLNRRLTGRVHQAIRAQENKSCS